MSMSLETHKGLRPLPAGVMSAALAIGAAVIGNMATMPNLPWYDGLAKPPLTPPNWVFSPAWTTLFILMAIAFYRVLRLDPETPGRQQAVTLYIVQLVFNVGWSYAFFAAQNPALGLSEIIPFEGLVLATIYAFWRVDRVAAWLLIPYAMWVAFATYLNAGVWWLN